MNQFVLLNSFHFAYGKQVLLAWHIQEIFSFTLLTPCFPRRIQYIDSNIIKYPTHCVALLVFFSFYDIFFLPPHPIILDDSRVICVAIFSLHICLYVLAPHDVVFMYNLSVSNKLETDSQGKKMLHKVAFYQGVHCLLRKK